MPRTQLHLANCNLYNLNLPGLRMYRDPDGWPPIQYRSKLRWLGHKIASLPADVWAFQELWHQDALHQVFESANKRDYELLVPDAHQGARIACAAAVRREILTGAPEWIETFPPELRLQSQGEDPQTPDLGVDISGFSRPVLKFTIKPKAESPEITVFVCHFKSKAPTAVYREDWYRANRDLYSPHSEAIGSAISTMRRTAEATALRVILTKLMKHNDNPVIVMGDLNDSQHSNTLNILTGQPNYLLSGLSRGGSDTDLYSVETLQEYRSQRDVYYTHVYQNHRESLDHILVSQEFYDNSHKRLWAFKGMQLFNDHLNSHNHKVDGSTDHGIVSAHFEYRPS